jgi:alpha/beta superfamily hydrolase
MDNAIVVAVCRALATRKWAALRFNFRRAFDGGRGEMDDVAGALDSLLDGKEARPDQVAVIGYSFGAQVGLHHAARDARVGRLVGIALTQDHYADPFLDDDPRPKLFIAGEYDAWAPPDAMGQYVARLESSVKRFDVIRGADHFFVGYESRIGTSVADWLAAG